jgi:hypothetical protein
MTTCEASPQLSLLTTDTSTSTSLPEVSPAKTSRSQASRRALRAHAADYGRKLPDWLASYDPDTSSWRTSQTSLLAPQTDQVLGLVEFSETWPISGMMRSGTAYQLAPLAPTSLANECGSSPRLPRPVACDGKGAGRLRWERINGGGMNLRDWCAYRLGMAYPPVLLVGYLMGFPAGWTISDPTETP